jgi:hypothetical protein
MGKRPPRVWLFSGETGSGKTTIAKIMTVAYNCTHMKLWGDPCDTCTEKSWAKHEINAAEHSGVEDVESLIHIANHKPLEGSKRVITVDECQALSAQAWKALLKPTEETPPHTVWIFCTSELRKVPAANQRRPVKYTLLNFKIEEVETFLKKSAAAAGIKQPMAPLIDAALTIGLGTPGVLLQALEKYGAGCSAEESVTGVDTSTLDVVGIAKAVQAGNWPKVLSILPKNLTPEVARTLRAFVSSWLRGGLVSPKMHLTPKQQEAAALGIIDLADAPYDDVIVYWISAMLWKVTKRYRQ